MQLLHPGAEVVAAVLLTLGELTSLIALRKLICRFFMIQ